MTKESTKEELKKQIIALNKQIGVLKSDLAKKTDKHKKAEIDIEEAGLQIKQFRTALDNLDTYVYIKDKQRRYLYANKKTLKLFKCTAEELPGCEDSRFFPPETCEQLAQIDRRILEFGENTALEVESKDSDGNRLVYWEIKTPIFDPDDKSKIIGLCGISNDITERKKVEETIKESELKLKELNATKDKLFSIIAHDLRGPFNNILGFSEILIENEMDPEEAKRHISIINSSAKNTLVLLDNLLNWAKSQTGELGFRPEKMIMSKVIHDVIKINKSLAEAKNISLQYSETSKIELFADKNILKTVLRNLVSNAIKFTNHGGYIKVLATRKQQAVEISISDNGVGIDEEALHKLFDFSDRITSPGTANEKGSGLGLVLCKEFVNKLDGHIWVESEKGIGSSFTFSLPLNNAK